MSFEKLSKPELLRTADEDFAVEVDKAWPKKKIIEALEESGVDFSMYLEQNPEKAEEFSEVPENVVTEPVVKPAEPVQKNNEKLVLIKMLRENPLFQIKNYVWTQDRPYVLVTEADANNILIQEEGFRQATPAELEEYYS